MQPVSSRIWTRVAVSISYDDNHYTTGTSIEVFMPQPVKQNQLSKRKLIQTGIMEIDRKRQKYVGHSISFQTSFVPAFIIGVDSWKFSTLLLYIFWHDCPFFMISASKKQLHQELEYTLTY